MIEECGEVLSAAGKTQRWGPYSSNPLIEDPETNIAWLWRELQDLKSAVARLEDSITEEFGNWF